jgi:AcrR family transcriptional regulator
MASSDRPPERTGARLPPTGLRERKKQRTRDAIQREAMRLFQEQGYEATTIEQIAEAADISPSTFFNYFPTKEDVVFNDPYDPIFISLFLARPSDEPLSVALRRTFSESLSAILERDRDTILARVKMTVGVPALRARLWGEVERNYDLFAAVLAERTGRDPYAFDLRVSVMMIIGAMFAAELEWLRNDGRDDLVELINRALDQAAAGPPLDALDRQS